MQEVTRPEGGEKSLERQIRAFHWIRMLAELPHRKAGSAGEREAGERVEAWLRDLGLEEIERPKAPSRPHPGWNLALHLGLAALGSWLGGWSGLALVAAATLSLWRETRTGRPGLSRWIPRRATHNVVARVGADRPRRRVVLTATLDAPTPGRLFERRFGSRLDPSVGAARSAVVPIALLAVTSAVAASAALGADGGAIAVARFLVGGLCAIGSLGGLEWARAASTPGAADNAAGIAAMLTATEQLAAQLPPDVELWCAAAGASQVGSAGAQALLAAHPEWLSDRTAFVHFEGLGAGELHWVQSEGGFEAVAYPPMLTELARRVSASDAYGVVKPGTLSTDTDGQVFARAGAQVLTLTTLLPAIDPARPRERDDLPEHVDTELVVRAADFGCCVVSAYLRGDAEPLAYV
ncbi:MAG: M28 family peptidase [Myxococcota bacterium]